MKWSGAFWDALYIDIIVVAIVSSAQDKCEPRFTVIENHSACLNKSDEVGSSGVTEVEKKEILDTHNLLRSQVNPPAKNMMKMSWDNDVALVAQKWAENCDLKHDGKYQRRIPGRFSAGQNLLWSEFRITWNVTIYALYVSEVSKFTYGGPNPPGVGHYTQIVWADSIKVGCGYAHCQTKGLHYYVCNYSPGGNSYNMQPYKNGTSCADCPNRCENNLCDCDGVVCENDGILDLTTCSCHCSLNRPYYTGSQCSLNCSALTPDSSFCTSLSVAECAQYSNVPYMCPVLCKVCNYRLASVTDTTIPSTSTSNSIVTTTVPSTSITSPFVVTITPSAEKCEPRFTVIKNHSACLNKSTEVGSSGVTNVEKKEIVDTHNLLRSQVKPPAKNMMKMSWDDDVALVAQKWAENCELKHDGNYQRRIPGKTTKYSSVNYIDFQTY
ncbi:cysteine-rich venom protein Mr30-like [Ostrea edulis]|uniref:cysteine-rich venom protein Mr30-like n=1 Tax=Ostrea edulis TaxID=37623 RepID=UPI0024AEFECD|nr:cysteine-rich venom protein Mr30-like [Ostrea edulis]